MATSHERLPSRSRLTVGGGAVRLSPVRLASRDELAAAARVAPLLRAACDLAAWVGPNRPLTDKDTLTSADADAAATALDLSPVDITAAWTVAAGSGMLVLADGRAAPGDRLDVLRSGDDREVLALWADALRSMLDAENLDALATALYTAGGPVRIDALFEAYAAAEGTRPHGDGGAAGDAGAAETTRQRDVDASGLSASLEILADLGAVELGADEDGTGLTVSLSPLGVWGMRDRLSARGWRVPVVGGSATGSAAAVLTTLADYNAEDGEAEIAAWLEKRSPRRAAAELVEAASTGSPGMRGAAFAVLDRVGEAAVPAVREALGDPVLRPHAAVWLREHGEQVELSREDRAWLLVDLGAGLLEEADPEDVVADLLPDLPPKARLDLVAALWRVDHPRVVELLVALTDHHPDPDVAKAARKAAFKARSRR